MLQAHANPAAVDALRLATGAVEHLERGDDVESLSAELDALAEALRAAARACERSASRVLPPAEALDRSICSRYQRAAARWPVSPPPSYERFAAALACLHEAADAARLAARSCERARDAVGVLLQPPRLR